MSEKTVEKSVSVAIFSAAFTSFIHEAGNLVKASGMPVDLMPAPPSDIGDFVEIETKSIGDELVATVVPSVVARRWSASVHDAVALWQSGNLNATPPCESGLR